MDYKITAPNVNYTGESAGVNFAQGVGIAKDGKSVDWFTKKGYKVEPVEVEEKKEEKKPSKDPKGSNEEKKPKGTKDSKGSKKLEQTKETDKKLEADGTGDVDDSSGNSFEQAEA